MSDVNVTLTSLPINVTVATPGPPGPPGVGTASNLIGLISTGSADLRYYPLSTNPSGYLTSATAAGVNRINNLSGSVTIQGTGNVVVTTGLNSFIIISGNTGFLSSYYSVSNPEHYLKSGEATNSNVSGLISTGTADLRYIQTGASGYFYPWSNPNNFLRSGDITQANTSGLAASGNLEATGTALQNQITSITNGTGVFIQNSNLNGLISTGQGDLRYLQTGVSGEFYKVSNPNQFINSGDVNNISGSLQQNIERSGGYLFGLINASSAGVSSINSASGAMTINGAGNVSIITAGQTITISGNTGEYINFYKTSNPNNFSNSGNVENTGTALQNQIISIQNGTGVFIQLSNLNGLISTGAGDLRYLNTGSSGYFYPWNNPNNFIKSGEIFARNSITGISVTGGVAITGNINITGVGGLQIIQYGNNIQFSGGGGGTTNNTFNSYAVNSGSGLFIYRSGISSGISEQFINFPTVLDAKPIVIASLHNDDFNTILGYQISGANTTGFWVVLSDTTNFTGYYLDIFASNSTETGMATNVIVNNTIISGSTTVGITGASISGGISITGALNINAGSNITLTQNGLNSFSISSSAGGGSITNGVTGVSITGGVAISGELRFTGIGGLQIHQYGNNIQFSGGAGTTNVTNNYPINSGSGIFLYRSGIASGVSKQFINFPTMLDDRPIVIASLHNDLFDTVAFCQISGANPTGFWAVLSTVTENTGFYLDVYSSNSTATGMAANVIVNNYITTGVSSAITGISVTGGIAMTSVVNITAGQNITLTQVGLNRFSIATTTGAGGGSPTNGVTGISITGGVSISGAIRIVGVGNVVAYQSGNTIVVSGITTLPQLYIGSGSPEGSVSAAVGSIYSDWYNRIQYNKFTGAAEFGWF